MITGKSIFQIVLTDEERNRLHEELRQILPLLDHRTALMYPILYQIRAECREPAE